MSQAIKFHLPKDVNLGRHILSAAARKLPLVEKGCHASDRGIVICALGHSLERPSVLGRVRALAKRGWHVLGIKEAIPFLIGKGIKVHYSVNMDPTERDADRMAGLVRDGVTYCVASSCHPKLFDALLNAGAEVKVYHSACGYFDTTLEPGIGIDLGYGEQAILLGEFNLDTVAGHPMMPVVGAHKDEVSFYQDHFGVGDTMCGGYTVGNRAVALASYMGFNRNNIVVAGLDFGWRDGGTYYAGFCQAQHYDDVYMTDNGLTDGKPWHTRPDLMASAVDLARKVKDGGVKVIGDSLAAALAKRDDDYLERCCQIR